MKISSEWFNKKLFFGFLILVALLTFVDWILFGRTPIHEIKSVTTAVSEKIAGHKMSGFAGAAQAAAVSAAAAVQQQPAVPVFDPTNVTKAQFKEWFGSEVSQMNQYHVDADAVQQRYLQITAKMSPAQFKELSVVARTKSPNINERVLAAYLLGFSGYANVGDLAAFASSPIVLDGKPEVHTVAETQQVQERALRVLAIDRLADLAHGENIAAAKTALTELVKLSQTVKDPSVKVYAENKLKEISK
ncbi:hypothetical protein CIK05_14545 [Bdellovibrio sp. qaytius]|nr:hypothetical protein CIK05_14545 [Bdellovibrio sp. qaytius]